MAESHAGSFRDVVGGDSSVNVLRTIYDLTGSDIEKGTTYSFRYRVYNAKGWSEFSDVRVVVAADVPS